MKIINAILRLLDYNFLDIFWFYWWIFLAGELVFYTLERLLGFPAGVRLYDLTWLIVIYTLAFVTAYRLYSRYSSE